MTLTGQQFGDFFKAIHGYRPFPWQDRLARRLCDRNAWPAVLDLPTGSGKTAAIDAAVFHLAVRYDEPERAAIRIALVVDRRIVVDDAYERARKIVRAIADTQDDEQNGPEVLQEVARRLQRLAGAGELPLTARRLRGGTPLEPEWARTPTQPTIICSTIDQIGSRLLFRGYGISDRMKPVHAGLLGTGTLILIDEAHLAEPFRRTVDRIRHLDGANVRTVVLSATPGTNGDEQDPIELKPDDWADEELGRRLRARKPAELKTISKNGTVEDEFAGAARQTGRQLRDARIENPAIGIVVNRVGTARRIFETLQKQKDAHEDAVLIIGPSREIDRSRMVERLQPFRTGENRRPIDAADPANSKEKNDTADGRSGADTGGEQAGRTLYIVATQCIEVGIDLDLDGLVTQAAALDALRQRFGRLNRAGRHDAANAVILATTDDLNRAGDDFVYGDRIWKTWTALNAMATGNAIDFGVEAFEEAVQASGTDTVELAAPRATAPTVMPAYIELWSQTSPIPMVEPEIDLFLHGIERRNASVSIAWRGDVDKQDLERRSETDLTGLLTALPPRTSEIIDVPVAAAREWLQRGHERTEMADAPERATRRERGEQPQREAGRPAFRWAGPDSDRTGTVYASDIRTGDTIVVPAAYGGCDASGWNPETSETATDVADAAARPYRRKRFAVRVTPDQVNDPNVWNRIAGVIATDGLTSTELTEQIRNVTADMTDAAETNGTAAETLDRLLRLLDHARRNVEVARPYGDDAARGIVLTAPGGIADPEDTNGKHEAGGPPSTEEKHGSTTADRRIALDDHAGQTRKQAAEFADRLRLPAKPTGRQASRRDVLLAAHLHDIGKADRRFQTLLTGGDRWNRPTGQALAKSNRTTGLNRNSPTGLPTGWRHEAMSVRMAAERADVRQADDSELILWLMGTHHGYGRPFFRFRETEEGRTPEYADCPVTNGQPTPNGPGPEAPAYEHDGRDWARIGQRLRRKYGTWGLAYMEAVVRLADHRASE